MVRVLGWTRYNIMKGMNHRIGLHLVIHNPTKINRSDHTVTLTCHGHPLVRQKCMINIEWRSCNASKILRVFFFFFNIFFLCMWDSFHHWASILSKTIQRSLVFSVLRWIFYNIIFVLDLLTIRLWRDHGSDRNASVMLCTDLFLLFCIFRHF